MAKNDSKQNTFTSLPHDHNRFDFLFICFISFLFYLFHFSAESEIQDDCTRGRGATAFLSPVLSARTCHFREQNAVLRRNRKTSQLYRTAWEQRDATHSQARAIFKSLSPKRSGL